MFLYSTAQELATLRTQLQATLNQNEDLKQLLKKFHITIPECLAKPASVNVTFPMEVVNTVAPITLSNTASELEANGVVKPVVASSNQNQLGFSFHSVATIVNSSLQAETTSTANTSLQTVTCVPNVPYVIVNQQPVGTATAVCYVSPVTMAATTVNNVDPNLCKSSVGNNAAVAVRQPNNKGKSTDQALSKNDPKNAVNASKRRIQNSSNTSNISRLISAQTLDPTKRSDTAVSIQNISAKEVQVMCSSKSQNSLSISAKPAKMPRMNYSQSSVTTNIPVNMDICQHEEILNIQNFPVSSLIPSIDDQPSSVTSLLSKQDVSTSQDGTQSSTNESANKAAVSKTNQIRQSPRSAYSIESLTSLSNGEQHSQNAGHPFMSTKKVSQTLTGQCQPEITSMQQIAVPLTSATSSSSYSATQKQSVSSPTQLPTSHSKAQPQLTYSQTNLLPTQTQPQVSLTRNKPQKSHLQAQTQPHQAPLAQSRPHPPPAQSQSRVSNAKAQTKAASMQNQSQRQQNLTHLQLVVQPQVASSQPQGSSMQVQPQIVSSQSQVSLIQMQPQLARSLSQASALQVQPQVVLTQVPRTQLQPMATHAQSQNAQPGFGFSAEALLGSSDDILSTSIPSINASLTETSTQATNMFPASTSGNLQELSSRGNSQHSFSNFSAEALLGGNDLNVEHNDSSHVTSTQEKNRGSSLQNQIFTDFSAESLIGPSDLSAGLSSYAIDNLIGRSGTSSYNSSAMITVNPNLIHTSVAETTTEHSVNPLRALAALPSMVELKGTVSTTPNSVFVTGSSLSNSSHSLVPGTSSQATTFSYNLNQKNNSSKSNVLSGSTKPTYTVAGSSSSNVLKYSIDSIASSFYSPGHSGSLFLTGGTSSNSLPIVQSYTADPLSVMPQFSFGLGGPFSPTRTVSGPTTGGFV